MDQENIKSINKKIKKTKLLDDSVIEDPNNIKISRKIRFYPSVQLKKYFSKCFGTYRFFYNKSVSNINTKYDEAKEKIDNAIPHGCCHYDNNVPCLQPVHYDSYNEYFCDLHIKEKVNYGTPSSFINLRKEVLTPNSELKEETKWQEDIPYDIRQNAISDAFDSLQSNLSKIIAGQQRFFKLKYKTKKDTTQIFKLPSTMINLKNKRIFMNTLKGINNRFRFDNKTERWFKKNIKTFNSKVTILREARKYYFCLSYTVRKEDKKESPFKVCSIDPGIRKFLTVYSPDGVMVDIGVGTNKILTKIAERIDLLTSKMNEVRSKTRRGLKRRCTLLRNKIGNIRNDLHYKTSNFLCNNFETIILPDFETSEKVKCYKRNINDTTTRETLMLSHYTFKKRLENMCKRMRKLLIITGEDYTTQTCGKCGNLDKEIGGKKIYECKKCEYTEDRDLNGARNVLLRYLEQYGVRSDPLKAK
jgi:transposase